MWKLSDSARAPRKREPLLEIAIIKLANYSIEAVRKELLYFMTVVRCAILLITLDNGQAGAPIATFFYDRIFHRKITQLLFLSTFLGPLQIQTRVFISSWNKISCFVDMFQSCLAKKKRVF